MFIYIDWKIYLFDLSDVLVPDGLKFLYFFLLQADFDVILLIIYLQNSESVSESLELRLSIV